MTRRDIDKYLDMYYRLTGKVRKEVDKDLFETLEEVFDSATILAVLNLVRKGILSENSYIWVTPGIPLIIFILLGFILSIVLGDIILYSFLKTIGVVT